jgi:hypothetical protein
MLASGAASFSAYSGTMRGWLAPTAEPEGANTMTDEMGNTIRDIDVPFWRIVMIPVKWSIASIPAMIILMLLASLIAAIVGVILAAIGVHVPTPPTPTP